MSMRILVYLFLLPVEEELSTAHIASGSIAVLNSWITLIQYLKVVPVMGIYIIVVQKIFYTVMKVCDVMPTAKNVNSIHNTYFNLTYIMT
jgi:hypothetical protein